MDRHDQSACDPLSQAEHIVATSARRRQRQEHAMTTVWAFGPFLALIAALWFCANNVRRQFRQFTDLLHSGWPRPIGDLQMLVVKIPLALLATLALAFLVLEGTLHLLRHRSVAGLIGLR